MTRTIVQNSHTIQRHLPKKVQTIQISKSYVIDMIWTSSVSVLGLTYR